MHRPLAAVLQLTGALAPWNRPLTLTPPIGLPLALTTRTVARAVQRPRLTAVSPCSRPMLSSCAGGNFRAVALPANSSRFGLPESCASTDGVDCASSCCVSCVGVSVGRDSSSSASVPATCGAAIEVPLSMRSAVWLRQSGADTHWPGASRSTQLPKFEKTARLSVLSLAPTVIAPGTRAGERRQALLFSLPADTTTWKPASSRLRTASSSIGWASAPRLMLTTAGRS